MTKRILSFVIFIGIFSGLGHADTKARTIQTNVEGLLLKKAKCGYDSFYGNVTNRSDRAVSGTLYVKVLDTDNDPVGQCSTDISLGPRSGGRFNADSCNCDKGTREQVHFKAR